MRDNLETNPFNPFNPLYDTPLEIVIIYSLLDCMTDEEIKGMDEHPVLFSWGIIELIRRDIK